MLTLHLISTAVLAGAALHGLRASPAVVTSGGLRGVYPADGALTEGSGWVTLPARAAELATAAWLVVAPPSPSLEPLAQVGLALVLLIWTSSALLQAPGRHLPPGGSGAAMSPRLERTHRIRATARLVRVPLAIALLLG